MKNRYFATWIFVAAFAALTPLVWADPPDCTDLEDEGLTKFTLADTDKSWLNPANWDRGVPDSTKVACIEGHADIWQYTCPGGDRAGHYCSPPSYCWYCDSGLHVNNPCTSDNDCKGRCFGGFNPGQPCSSSAGCEGGICVGAGSCYEATCSDTGDVDAQAIVIDDGASLHVFHNASLTLYGYFECEGGTQSGECDPDDQNECPGGECVELPSTLGADSVGMPSLSVYEDAELRIAHDLTIYGDGSMMYGIPDATTGEPATIKAAAGSGSPVLTLQGDDNSSESTSLVMEEDWVIDVGLVNKAYITADCSADCKGITLQGAKKSGSGYWVANQGGSGEPGGTLTVKCEVEGSGTWIVEDVSTSKIVIDATATCTNLEGDVNVKAGTFEVNAAFTTSGDVDISGGKLDVNEDFTATGDLVMTGGTIEVASGKEANFD